MARRRGQRNGYLYQKGPSWMLRWREDVISSDGKITRMQFARAIAPATGPDAFTKREAQRLAWDEILSKLDQATLAPQSLATVAQFIDHKFLPEWVWSLKPAGKKHYEYVTKQVKAAIGGMRLRQVTTSEVQRAIHQLLNQGYSVQTATHFRNCVSAIFRHARAVGWIGTVNPAEGVRLPAMQRRPAAALTVEELLRVLGELPDQVALMVEMSCITTLNVAELCGLEWRHVNLTNTYMILDGEAIPRYSIAVRQNRYEGETCSTKTGRRRRTVPLPAYLVERLERHHATSAWPDAGAPVFANRDGGYEDRKNLQQRKLKPAVKRAADKWQAELEEQGGDIRPAALLRAKPMGWHIFRHTASTFLEYVGMEPDDRVAMMGHSALAMTMQYTHKSIERRRDAIEQVARLLNRPPTEQ